MKKQIVTAKAWVRDNADRFNDREKFYKEACKATGKDRKRISSCLGELLRAGDIKNTKLLAPRKPKAGSFGSGDYSKKRPSDSTKSRSVSRKSKRLPRSISFAMVKKDFDDEGKLVEGLENLGENLIKDNDFRLDLGVGLDRWKAVTGSEKWEKYKIDLRGKQYKGTFWGNPDVIAELRKSVDVL